jgi:signal transduction histidine kinase
MLKPRFSIGVTGVALLLSVMLFGLGTAAVLFLFVQQAASAGRLTEDVESRRIARELETTFQDLIALLRDNHVRPDALHERVANRLERARAFADKPRERELVSQLERCFRHYLATWQKPPTERSLSLAIAILNDQALPLCTDLREFNAHQIEESEAAHRQFLTMMAWGLGGVGVVGSLGGIFLGYSVARRLRHSVYQLSVSVRDAANRLGQELPMVTLTESGDLQHVHEQLQTLLPEIEQVVERLQQREREVLRAEQMAGVGQLAAGVAHELRNPLTSVKLLVQTNREEAEARGLPVEDLSIIEQEIRRMERCLQNFLDFARPPRLQRRLFDLAAVVQRTFALVGGRAQKQLVTLDFQAPAEPIRVEADPEQLHQLLVNLALNALDAMPHGGTLSVELTRTDGQAELHVLDTGAGVAPEILPRLFQPFASSKETGLGMGLVVSRRIAESHGGTLTAANRPGGGACFTLCIPALPLVVKDAAVAVAE